MHISLKQKIFSEIQICDKKAWTPNKRSRNTSSERSEEFCAISPCQILVLLPYHRDNDLDEDDNVKQEYQCYWQKEWPQHGLFYAEILILIQGCKPATFHKKRGHFKRFVRHVSQNTKTKQNNTPLFHPERPQLGLSSTNLSRKVLDNWGLSIMPFFSLGSSKWYIKQTAQGNIIRWNIANPIANQIRIWPPYTIWFLGCIL